MYHMCRLSFSIVAFLLLPHCLSAQWLPAEGRSLNYRIIGFSFPIEKKAANYRVEIAQGHYIVVDSFEKHLVCGADGHTNRIVVEVPAFATDYTWRLITSVNSQKSIKSELHHFSTAYCRKADSSLFRLRILRQAEKYHDAFVFVDASKTMYDMNGRPVWFLPSIGGDEDFAARDLKVTPQATITFIAENKNIYEINFDGDVLWKGPVTGTVAGWATEQYHHSFTRLGNGHYFVLGQEPVWWDTTTYRADYHHYADSIAQVMPNTPNPLIQRTNFGTLIEYDEKGNPVWYWKSSDYFRGSDLRNYQKPPGSREIDVCENGFYVDEKKKEIYLSFQGISRILKIRYPEGTVVNTYGELFRQGYSADGHRLFCAQANVGLSGDSCLYLLNTSCGMDLNPGLEMLRVATDGTDSVNRVWDYQLPSEIIDTSTLMHWRKGRDRGLIDLGGNISELPGKEFFVSLYMPFGYLFIVSRDKNMLWTAVQERWFEPEKRWVQETHGRSNLVLGKKELEKLIWNNK